MKKIIFTISIMCVLLGCSGRKNYISGGMNATVKMMLWNDLSMNGYKNINIPLECYDGSSVCRASGDYINVMPLSNR